LSLDRLTDSERLLKRYRFEEMEVPLGMFVTDIGPEEVQQLSSLRVVLETEALRLVLARMTPAVLASLEKLIAQMDVWDGTLLEATGVTVRRLLVGYFIGIMIGLPLGLFTSAFKFVEDII